MTFRSYRPIVVLLVGICGLAMLGQTAVAGGKCSIEGIYYVTHQWCAGKEGRTSGFAEVFQRGERILFRNECNDTVLGFLRGHQISLDENFHQWGPLTATVDHGCNVIEWSSGSIWRRQIDAR